MDLEEARRRLDLIRRFRPGDFDRYELRRWREYGLRRNNADEIRIAEEVLADTREYAASPWIELRDYLIDRLNDPDSEVRDAAIQALVVGSTYGIDFAGGTSFRGQLFDLESTTKLIPILVGRLRSPECTHDDRLSAAWLLPRLGIPATALISVLLTVLDELGSDAEARRLRCALIRALAGLEAPPEQMVPHVQRLLRDPHSVGSRRQGVWLATSLGKCDRRLLKAFSPDIEPLLSDADDEVRRLAGLFFEPNESGANSWTTTSD